MRIWALILTTAFLFVNCKGKDSPKDDQPSPPKNAAPKAPMKELTPCEKAFDAYAACVDPKATAERGKYVDECRKWMVGSNDLLKKDITCWSKAHKDCKVFEKCLPAADKDVCQVFADTRLKCRRAQLKKTVGANFRETLVATCKKDLAAADKAYTGLYNCFTKAREICGRSSVCFKNLDDHRVKATEAAKKALEDKFKKISKRQKRTYTHCVDYHTRCVADFKDKDLAQEACKQLLFNKDKGEKARLSCIDRNYRKCPRVTRCLKKLK